MCWRLTPQDWWVGCFVDLLAECVEVIVVFERYKCIQVRSRGAEEEVRAVDIMLGRISYGVAIDPNV